MDRRQLLVVLGAGALATPLACFAQQRGKVWRIGILMPASANTNTHYYRAFVEGLQERGLIVDKLLGKGLQPLVVAVCKAPLECNVLSHWPS